VVATARGNSRVVVEVEHLETGHVFSRDMREKAYGVMERVLGKQRD
jgi:hypothetical protein